MFNRSFKLALLLAFVAGASFMVLVSSTFLPPGGEPEPQPAAVQTQRARHRHRDMEQRGFMFVVAKLACRFRRPAHYDELLTLKVRIARTTRVKIEHEYELYRDGILLCEASTVLACVDSQGRLISIPDDIING